MTITLDQIKSLREKTGVSTMACKKALEEANGNEEEAITILRKKGESKAAERAGRSTSNGVVAIAKEDGKMAMVALACETDFVAKNEDFVKAAKNLAEKLLKEGEDTDTSDVVSDLTVALGEKIAVPHKVVVEGKNIGSYVHLNNKIGVLIKLDGNGEENAGNEVAMHIAAMNPKNVSPEDVSEEAVTKEKSIWIEQLKQEGKPEEIIGRIMMGKEKKFREESALLTQPFVKNPEMLIKDVLSGFTVDNFWRFEI